jgi:hypothetical protein
MTVATDSPEMGPVNHAQSPEVLIANHRRSQVLLWGATFIDLADTGAGDRWVARCRKRHQSH